VETELQWTEAIGRNVMLRQYTVDRTVWSDTFTGKYHVPPDTLPSPLRVLDLGCNIGLTVAHYEVMWPQARIVGVEMDHDCAELARLNAPQSIIMERAVGGERGAGSYNPDVRSDSFSLGGSGREVEVYDLKTTIIDAFGDETVDFMKVDIEGACWDVFDDDSWCVYVSSLLVELHGAGTSKDLVMEGIKDLCALGYKAQHHRRHPQAVFAWKQE